MSGQKIIDGLEDVLADRVGRMTTIQISGPQRDPEYDWLPPMPPLSPVTFPTTRKGIQCGECGMKFDYNKAYGYACQHSRCPRSGFSR